MDNVLEASVSLATSRARVVVAMDSARGGATSSPSSLQLARAAEAAGFPSRVLGDDTAAGTVVVLDVKNLKCGACVSSVEAALLGVEGVREAVANLCTGTATVTVEGGSACPAPGEQAAEALVETLRARGYPSTVLSLSSDVGGAGSGMGPSGRRATPAQRYERDAWESRGRLHASLVLLAASSVLHLRHCVCLPPLLTASSAIGRALESLPIWWMDWAQLGLATAAVAGPGFSLIRSGIASMRRRSPSMDSLVATGVLAAYSSSVLALLKPSFGLAPAFHEPVMLLGAVLLGRSLEARQRLKAARGLQGLFDARPDRARRVDDDGRVAEVPADLVRVGDVVEVLPSDIFPTDGVVLAGRTAADESSLTGEATPVPKGPGDAVRAGTRSAADGEALRMRATATGAQTVLASVIALVEDAQANKPRVQRLADRVAGRLTWVVLAVATSTLLFWGCLARLFVVNMGGSARWALGLRLAVDVCLVACPCSLGLATPTAIMVGTGWAAERGIVLTGADALEIARKVTCVIFDKTGTLTTGKPSVTSVLSLHPEWTEHEVLQVAAAVERGCRHPLAEAVVSRAEGDQPGGPSLAAEDFRTMPGLGARAKVRLGRGPAGAREVHVGSAAYISRACPEGLITAGGIVGELLRRDQDGPVAGGGHEGGVLSEIQAQSSEVSRRIGAGETVILVAVGEEVVGLLFVADTSREGAALAVADLLRRGLTVRLASGDRMEAVRRVAREAGVPSGAVLWGATPADKASLIRELKERGEVVMMVGDGFNDAPALSAADIGVAMRGGTGSAMDAADVILMRDDLACVGRSIDISRLTTRKVRENLAWALGYNILAIPIAAGVFLPGLGLVMSPAFAGALMSCSSVAVVTNSLMLRRSLDHELAASRRRHQMA